ncbi:hypothetical protein ACOME3_001072 [Neoechinorhynchus agilis]
MANINKESANDHVQKNPTNSADAPKIIEQQNLNATPRFVEPVSLPRIPVEKAVNRRTYKKRVGRPPKDLEIYIRKHIVALMKDLVDAVEREVDGELYQKKGRGRPRIDEPTYKALIKMSAEQVKETFEKNSNLRSRDRISAVEVRMKNEKLIRQPQIHQKTISSAVPLSRGNERHFVHGAQISASAAIPANTGQNPQPFGINQYLQAFHVPQTSIGLTLEQSIVSSAIGFAKSPALMKSLGKLIEDGERLQRWINGPIDENQNNVPNWLNEK